MVCVASAPNSDGAQESVGERSGGDGDRAWRGADAQPNLSSAAFTSASAPAFCARGTVRIRQRSNSPSAAIASRYRGFIAGCLTL